jgi:hypothetical protein
VANVELDVTQPNGDVVRKVFGFGEIYDVEHIEIFDNDYANVLLVDGSRIDGVNRKVFENLGKVEMLQLYNEEPVATNEVVEAPTLPEDETDDSIMIPLEGTILSMEDEEEDDAAI